ncbi:MAG: hypothetical protein IJ593_10290 [Lachnospiraceae bacterium]|nr:hypothetical protein [Lachnospiraceae bacterium]
MGEYKIINSQYFDKEFIDNCIEIWIYNSDNELFSKTRDESNEKKIEIAKNEIETAFAKRIGRQYMSEDIEYVYNKYGEQNVIKFIQNLIDFNSKYGDVRIRTILSEEEIEEFLNYAKDNDVKPSTIPMNAKNFLKMCRICYDAAPVKLYPKGISDYYIYQDERGSAFHEDSTVLDKDCYEDDNKFLEKYPGGAYHFEEIRFGGPSIYIKPKSYHKKSGKKYVNVRTWTASFSGKTCEDGRSIKMFIALRRKKYPIIVDEPEEMLYSYLGSDLDNSLGYKYFNGIDEAKKYVKSKK